MTRKLMTVDTFRAEARGGATPAAVLLRATSGAPESIADDTRTASFVWSDGSVDLMGDDINPKGWELEDFISGNPVALFGHRSDEPPVGRASNVRVRKGTQLVGDITFAGEDIYPFADTIYKLVKNKFLNAVSVGFVPIEWKFVEDNDRPYGISFLRQRLIEISVVPCPANAHALVEARAAGIDTGPLMEWAEKLLDCGEKHILPRAEYEALRKAADGTGRTIYYIKTPRLLTTDESAHMSKQFLRWIKAGTDKTPMIFGPGFEIVEMQAPDQTEVEIVEPEDTVDGGTGPVVEQPQPQTMTDGDLAAVYDPAAAAAVLEADAALLPVIVDATVAAKTTEQARARAKAQAFLLNLKRRSAA